VSRFLILTADDFGLHVAVNEAVEMASSAGVLTATSLMVGESAAQDAVDRAQRLPGLRVGLHLTLADGHAVLPPSRIPDLVDARGRFGDRMIRDGFRFVTLPSVRRQLADEIRAQFEAFAATGLKLDHVNAHKHFHLHPTVLSMILRIGGDFGLASAGIRVPVEPPWALRAGNRALLPWSWLMKGRLQAAGIRFNDQLLGLSHSGDVSEARLLDFLSRLPDGRTEIYLHPATLSGAAIAQTMPNYRHAGELAALMSQRVRDRLIVMKSQGVTCGGFGDLPRKG
jgi:hopanoid biosynthesis associated protein HpnK